MLNIGCHLSSSGGFEAMGHKATSLGANTFQFFTRNPRGGRAKPMDVEDAGRLCAYMEAEGFAPVIAHAPYTMNACSKDEKTREFARIAMEDDLNRLRYLPGALYNFHPGSHVGQGIEQGIALIASLLNTLVDEHTVPCVLLETMAGKGSEVGGRFEELAEIIARADHPEKLGVCLDTCHVYDAGYDVAGDLDGVLTAFDKIIGLDKLKAVHLNDSMNPMGSHKDRHQCIGQGSLGLEAVVRIIRHPALKALPFCLETPNDEAGYAAEIALLRDAAQ